MQQRGRRSSSAALAVVEVDGSPTQLEPPEYLSKAEREIFVEMVRSVKPTHFVPADRYLVAAYAQTEIAVRDSSKNAAGGDLSAFMKFEKAAKLLAILATKLRLAPQSRMDGRQGEVGTRGPKPWGKIARHHQDDDD